MSTVAIETNYKFKTSGATRKSLRQRSIAMAAAYFGDNDVNLVMEVRPTVTAEGGDVTMYEAFCNASLEGEDTEDVEAPRRKKKSKR